MNIALIKSFTDKPWRSPATYDLIEKSLSEKWQVQSLATDDQGKLYDWLDELKTEFRLKGKSLTKLFRYIILK